MLVQITHTPTPISVCAKALRIHLYVWSTLFICANHQECIIETLKIHLIRVLRVLSDWILSSRVLSHALSRSLHRPRNAHCFLSLSLDCLFSTIPHQARAQLIREECPFSKSDRNFFPN